MTFKPYKTIGVNLRKGRKNPPLFKSLLGVGRRLEESAQDGDRGKGVLQIERALKKKRASSFQPTKEKWRKLSSAKKNHCRALLAVEREGGSREKETIGLLLRKSPLFKSSPIDH